MQCVRKQSIGPRQQRLSHYGSLRWTSSVAARNRRALARGEVQGQDYPHRRVGSLVLVEHLVDTPLVRVLADARQHNAEPLDLGFFCAERLTLPTPRCGDATKSRGHA